MKYLISALICALTLSSCCKNHLYIQTDSIKVGDSISLILDSGKFEYGTFLFSNVFNLKCCCAVSDSPVVRKLSLNSNYSFLYFYDNDSIPLAGVWNYSNGELLLDLKDSIQLGGINSPVFVTNFKFDIINIDSNGFLVYNLLPTCIKENNCNKRHKSKVYQLKLSAATRQY